MRILLLNTDYPDFLNALYLDNPELADSSYAEQMARRNDTLFGVADFYSRNFAAHGHVAAEVHANNAWLQTAWAREHGMQAQIERAPVQGPKSSFLVATLKRRLRRYRGLLAPIGKTLGIVNHIPEDLQKVLLAQVEEFDPDVIINQDLSTIDTGIVSRMRKAGRVLVGYCGLAPPNSGNLSVYDLGLSMLDWVVEAFRARGLRAEKSHLAFEHTILDRLGPAPDRDIAVSFVGSITADHGGRIALLEAIAEKFPLEVWLPNLSALSPGSPLRRCYRGNAFGRGVYDIMRRSRITLNSHVDAARGQAANMRQFEATGVGSFLLTDNKAKLDELFVAGKEVATYDSVDDALMKIAHYLKDDPTRETIARAGQERTLVDHTYRARTAQILGQIATCGE